MTAPAVVNTMVEWRGIFRDGKPTYAVVWSTDHHEAEQEGRVLCVRGRSREAMAPRPSRTQPRALPSGQLATSGDCRFHPGRLSRTIHRAARRVRHLWEANTPRMPVRGSRPHDRQRSRLALSWLQRFPGMAREV